MNILFVDDHTLFREGFKIMLERCWDMPLHIVEVSTAEKGLEAAAQASFDVIFLDMGLPGGLGGIDCLRAFRLAQPDASLVVVSATEGAQVVRQAMQCGAQGYIPKSVDSDTLRDALQRILDGEIYVPEPPTPSDEGESLEALLTPRQAEVLAELCAGRTNREIGEYLAMSDDTVRAHVTAVLKRLDVRSRTEAVLLAKRKGWF